VDGGRWRGRVAVVFNSKPKNKKTQRTCIIILFERMNPYSNPLLIQTTLCMDKYITICFIFRRQICKN
jgi:hypothetical protein